jgi:hypothetical protein
MIWYEAMACKWLPEGIFPSGVWWNGAAPLPVCCLDRFHIERSGSKNGKLCKKKLNHLAPQNPLDGDGAVPFQPAPEPNAS